MHEFGSADEGSMDVGSKPKYGELDRHEYMHSGR